MSTIWNKKDNHQWSDWQTARLNVQFCRRRARSALDLLQHQEHQSLSKKLCHLEDEFYSDAKQTAMGLVFNTYIRLSGESEHESHNIPLVLPTWFIEM